MIVIQMDDYDWVACETIGQGIDFYLSETGVLFSDLCIKECDVDEDWMWWIIDEFPDSIGEEIRREEPRVVDGIRYGYFCGEKAKKITFAEAIELTNDKFPYIIATTEY